MTNDERIKKTRLRWQAMRSRCRTDYGYWGNGIRVCKRWEKFENFLEDMGPFPDGTSLDRIDGNGDYEPSNCRWADKETQQKNKVSKANRIKRPIDPSLKHQKKMVRYPSRIERSLIKQANAVRLKMDLTWPAFTRKVIDHFLKQYRG